MKGINLMDLQFTWKQSLSAWKCVLKADQCSDQIFFKTCPKHLCYEVPWLSISYHSVCIKRLQLCWRVFSALSLVEGSGRQTETLQASTVAGPSAGCWLCCKFAAPKYISESPHNTSSPKSSPPSVVLAAPWSSLPYPRWWSPAQWASSSWFSPVGWPQPPI